MRTYCAAYMLSREPAARSGLFVRKNRPGWQAGKLNAIGGSIEEGESPIEAQIREIFEETGLVITPSQCQLMLVLIGPKQAYRVYFFRIYLDEEFMKTAVTKTDEAIEMHIIDSLDLATCVPNLRWMLPMVIHHKHMDWHYEVYEGLLNEEFGEEHPAGLPTE